MEHHKSFSPENDFSEILNRLPPPRSTTAGEEDGRAFLRLLDIIDHLRGEAGCPFDREQTIPRLMNDLTEELHELREAAVDGERKAILSEVGDMILILLFIRRIVWEEDPQSMTQLLDHTSGKMVRRHPHVFLEPDPTIDSKTLWANWEKEKRKEKEHENRTSLLDGIPRTMSSLERAFRQGQKAARAGFDWTEEEDVWEKVIEEVGELSEARSEGEDRLDHELGDLLLALTSYARHRGLRPEESLARANDRFSRRFRHMEEESRRVDRDLSSLAPEEWNQFWENAKKAEESSLSPPNRDNRS